MGKKRLKAEWRPTVIHVGLPAALTIILFIGTNFFISLPFFREHLINSRKQMIRELTITGWELLDDYNQRVKSGELTLPEAQLRARERLRSLRYGPEGKDYFWIIDTHPRTIMHPYLSYLEGRDITNFEDKDGVKLFAKMVEVARLTGEGYVNYKWQWKDDSTKVVPKISYVKLYRPWGWIVGTGVYTEDVKAEIASITHKLNYWYALICMVVLLLSVYLFIREKRTARQKFLAEEKLRLSEARFRSMVETSTDLIWEINNKCVYTYLSPQVKDILGYEPDELIGKTPFDLMKPGEVVRISEFVQNLFADKQPIYIMANTCIHKDGHTVMLETNACPIFAKDGELIGYRGIDRDVTKRKRAIEALKAERDHSLQILKTTPVIICEIEPDGTLMYINPSGEDITGYDKDDLIGMELWSKLFPDSEYGQLDELLKKISKGDISNYELTMTCKGGLRKSISINTTNNYDDDGNLRNVLLAGVDISEQKQAKRERHEHLRFLENLERIEQALIGSTDIEEALSRMLDETRDIFGCDRAWLYYPANPEAEFWSVPFISCNGKYPADLETNQKYPMTQDITKGLQIVLGSTEPTSQGAGAESHIPDSIMEYSVKSLLAVGIRPKIGEAWLFGLHHCEKAHAWTKQEKYLFKEVSNRLSEALNSLLFMRDLKESEDRYRSLIETAGEGVWNIDLDARTVFVNQQMADMLGYTVEELMSKSIPDFLDDENKDIFAETFEKRLKGHGDKYEMIFRKKDGSNMWAYLNAKPLYDSDGKIIGSFAMIQDMTERKMATEALQRSENMFRGVFDQAFQYIGVLDPDGSVLKLNQTALDKINSEASEMCGIPFWDTPCWSFSAEHQNKIKQAIADGRAGQFVRFETIYPESDATADTVIDFSLTPVKDEAGEVILLIAEGRDITEIKLAQRELQKLRCLMANIINSMPSVLVGVDPDGKITQWNRQAEKLTQISADDAQGKILGDIFPQLALEMDKVRYAIKTRQPQKTEKVPTKEDGEVRFTDITVYPLVTNGIEGAVIRVDDVTDRVKIEEMMIQSEKMLSLGGLAAGMAHEINNPLAGILQNVQVIRNRLSATLPKNVKIAEKCNVDMKAIEHYMNERQVFPMIESVLDSGQRAAQVVNNMLSFSRQSSHSFELHDLKELTDKTIELAFNDYDLTKQYDFRQIKINKDYDPDTPRVSCEGTMIQQVILSILKNGAQAMFEASEPNAKPEFTISIAPQNSQVIITIADNGPGMDIETRKRVFEPFFTTKEVGTGTGLGLSVSYFIVTENHKGKLTVDSQPGKGAIFKITLPIKGGEA